MTFYAVTTELAGTVAAGDGICLNIQAPTLKDVGGDIRSQFSRKGFYTYSVVVFCDAALRIMAATAEQSGSTGDGMVHSCSWLHDLISKNKLPAQFHVVLDEAFKCTAQELSAHPKPRAPARLSSEQDAFNFYLSLQRQVIERCFALLTWRWGVFWRPIGVKFGAIKDLVACCCRCVLPSVCAIAVCVTSFTDCTTGAKRIHNSGKFSLPRARIQLLMPPCWKQFRCIIRMT